MKTIGDAYLVVGGVPDPNPDHLENIARFALEMREVVKQIKRDDGSPFSIRMGIHTGPVVAGVIGKSKFAYDLWGDTVNIASRMESQGMDNCIQVTEKVYAQLQADFTFKPEADKINVKGKGEMRVYFLEGEWVNY